MFVLKLPNEFGALGGAIAGGVRVPHTIRVLVADDHQLMRDGLVQILEAEPDIDVVAQAADGESAVLCTREHKPDVVLLDVRMPGGDGIVAISAIKEAHPQATVVILTMYDKEEYLFEAVREGAVGYVLKDTPSSEVVKAIRVAAAGGSALQPEMARKLIDGFSNISRDRTNPQGEPDDHLTTREHEVLKYLCRGLSNGDIAKRLYLSEKTVKKHVSKILKKLNVRSRSQAVVVAIQDKMVALVETSD